MSSAVRRLGGLPVRGLAPLVAESGREGHAFLRRLVAEWEAGENRFDRPGEVLFGAWSGPILAGIGGLNVDPFAGDEGTGRVRHLYVLPAHRRLGIGRELVAAVLDAARGRFVRLRLRTANPAAARLYERLGFLPCPGNQECSHLMEMTLGDHPRAGGGSGGRSSASRR